MPTSINRCGACLSRPPALDLCLAALSYEWPWSVCIARLKFRQDAGLAKALAGLMHGNLELARVAGRAHWILPVPSTQRRMGERGYNPAQLLAQALATTRCRGDFLERVGEPTPQRDLSRVERLKNPRGTFRLTRRGIPALPGRRVVLVDDVMTTGATLNELAKTLKNAGVREVAGLVLARD